MSNDIEIIDEEFMEVFDNKIMLCIVINLVGNVNL